MLYVVSYRFDNSLVLFHFEIFPHRKYHTKYNIGNDQLFCRVFDLSQMPDICFGLCRQRYCIDYFIFFVPISYFADISTSKADCASVMTSSLLFTMAQVIPFFSIFVNCTLLSPYKFLFIG